MRELQPNAVIFSDVGPDVRWVGNENGIASPTNWGTFNPVGEDGGAAAPGWVCTDESGPGHRGASQWLPAECDTSIRPGWFFHEKENDRVRTPSQLVDLYTVSVGRGCNLHLNVPPDRRGRINERDTTSLAAFGQTIRELFATNRAASATLEASNVRGAGDRRWQPSKLVDGNRATYWTTDDDILSADVTLTWPRPTPFTVVRVREHIALGQRVEAFGVDAWTNGAWQEFGAATTIGQGRIIRLASPVTTTRIRLRIVKSLAPPVISELGVY